MSHNLGELEEIKEIISQGLKQILIRELNRSDAAHGPGITKK